jgi:hypothetical protein
MAGCSTTETARDGIGSHGACWFPVVDVVFSMLYYTAKGLELENLSWL